MSDTPRTDANLITCRDDDYFNGPFIDPDFARQLELELNQWKQCAEELSKTANTTRWLAANSANHKFPEYKKMIEDLGRCAEVDMERFNQMKEQTK